MSHQASCHPSVDRYNRVFAIGVALNVIFVLTEFFFGFLTHSLALIADAGHNLSDVLGLLLAWGASWLMRRRPTQRYTYGLRRTSIYAAVINASLLLMVLGAIAIEAFQRLQNPVPVSGQIILGVALVGILINGITAWLLEKDHQQDLNLHGAFLHMLGDALVSLGVVISSLVILNTGWLWVDPVVSLAIAAFIAINTWQLLRDAVNLALDAVPSDIELRAVQTFLRELPGVTSVHDLHIWALSTTEPALTAHLVMPEGVPNPKFLSQVSSDLHTTFGIEHTTIQIESDAAAIVCSQHSCLP